MEVSPQLPSPPLFVTSFSRFTSLLAVGGFRVLAFHGLPAASLWAVTVYLLFTVYQLPRCGRLPCTSFSRFTSSSAVGGSRVLAFYGLPAPLLWAVSVY